MVPDVSSQLGFMGDLSHPQRSILLLSAVILVLHPRGSGIVHEVHAHHPELDAHALALQVLVDLMASIGRSPTSGSTVLIPMAVLVGQTLRRAAETAGDVSPTLLAEQLWELIEVAHESPDIAGVSSANPSRN